MAKLSIYIHGWKGGCMLLKPIFFLFRFAIQVNCIICKRNMYMGKHVPYVIYVMNEFWWTNCVINKINH
jgi:hypothetical protein